MFPAALRALHAWCASLELPVTEKPSVWATLIILGISLMIEHQWGWSFAVHKNDFRISSKIYVLTIATCMQAQTQTQIAAESAGSLIYLPLSFYQTERWTMLTRKVLRNQTLTCMLKTAPQLLQIFSICILCWLLCVSRFASSHLSLSLWMQLNALLIPRMAKWAATTSGKLNVDLSAAAPSVHPFLLSTLLLTVLLLCWQTTQSCTQEGETLATELFILTSTNA